MVVARQHLAAMEVQRFARGRASRREATARQLVVASTSLEEEARAIFTECDHDGNGHLTFKEMCAAVRALLSTDSEGRSAQPNLFETDAETYLQDHALGEEVFGPLGLVLRVSSGDEMQKLAKGFEGQLTATIQMDEGDTEAAKALMPILERKAGRVLVNGFPTGVEVCDAMVHGGPYPASTNFGATSVGKISRVLP